MFVFPDVLSKSCSKWEKQKYMRRWRREIKTLIRFISLRNGFHWLDDIVTEENVRDCLFELVSTSRGDDKIFNIIISFDEFTELPASAPVIL